MAIDFLGNELHEGDDVVFVTYNGTSSDLERGKITKVFQHQATVGTKRRAEYKFVKLPTIDTTEVMHGYWIFANAYEVFGGDKSCWCAHGNPIVDIYCSQCGFEPYTGDVVAISEDACAEIADYNYCPNCGARMDKEVIE